MGVACGDLDGDGLPDLMVTNFYGEGATLYRNLGQDLFADASGSTGLGLASRYLLGFGIGLARRRQSRPARRHDHQWPCQRQPALLSLRHALRLYANRPADGGFSLSISPTRPARPGR